MRWITRVLALLAVCTFVACGDDTETDASGGGSGSVIDDSETPVEPSEPETSVDPDCSETHPRRVSEPSKFTGFVVLCDMPGGTSMTIENISSAGVIEAKPDGQSWSALDVTKEPKPTFAQQLTINIVAAACDGESCVVPAGSTMKVTAGEPVRALLEVRGLDTASTIIATTLEEQINALLGTRSQRLADQATACGTEALDLIQGRASWEENLRHVLQTAPNCAGLAQQLDEGDPAERPGLVRSLAKRAQQLLGSSINDFLVLAAKVAAPG